MKNKEYLKYYLLQSLIVITIFSLLLVIVNTIEYNQYKRNFNYKINAILEKVEEKYPNLDQNDLVEILNSKETEDNVFKDYGYDIAKDSYVSKNDNYNLIFGITKFGILLVAFISLIYLFIKHNLKNDKEIDKIIKCIEKINRKNYELDLDELSEDKLSILKQEIYKTTIMLKENAENSLKDKINLKNSLQDISHQLKTPITSILIMLDNIIEDPDMDASIRNDFIIDIKRNVANINFLVQALLKLSKFDSNTVNFIKQENELENIAKESIQNVASLCDLRNIQIELNIKNNSKIICDLKWQIEAITNLLKNAIEHSNEHKKVVITVDSNNVYSIIEIKDFGQGIAEKDLPHIFERFYKGENSTSESIGIGLALAKTIIEQDNGNISVDSDENGTRFIVKYFKL